MSISAVKHQPLFPTEQRIFEVAQSERGNSKDLSFLIPTIGTLALGAIYATNVPIGMAVGVGTCALSVATSRVAKLLNLRQEDNDNEYKKFILDHPLYATIVAPFLEEGLFRGFLQPLTTRAIVLLIPVAATAFLGTSFSIATTVSIVATAALFGFVHIFNDHKNSHIQAVMATMGGVCLGVAAVQFGLAAAIAAHIVNNSLGVIFMKMSN